MTFGCNPISSAAASDRDSKRLLWELFTNLRNSKKIMSIYFTLSMDGVS